MKFQGAVDWADVNEISSQVLKENVNSLEMLDLV